MPKTPYTPAVLDHFQNPRNMGAMEDPSAVGQAGNAHCGDVVRLYLKIADGVIVHATAKVFGCPVAIAATSVLTELVVGKTLDEALAIRNDEVSTALGGLPAEKFRCSVLAEAVLRDAIHQYPAGPAILPRRSATAADAEAPLGKEP